MDGQGVLAGGVEGDDEDVDGVVGTRPGDVSGRALGGERVRGGIEDGREKRSRNLFKVGRVDDEVGADA